MAMYFAPPLARTSAALSDISRTIQNIGEKRMERHKMQRQHERALQEIELSRTDIESRARLGEIRLRGELGERAERRTIETRRFGEQQLTGKATREAALITGEAAKRRGEREVFQLGAAKEELTFQRGKRERAEELVDPFPFLGEKASLIDPETREKFSRIRREDVEPFRKMFFESMKQFSPEFNAFEKTEELQKLHKNLLDEARKTGLGLNQLPGLKQRIAEVSPDARLVEISMDTPKSDVFGNPEIDKVTGEPVMEKGFYIDIEYKPPEPPIPETEPKPEIDLSQYQNELDILSERVNTDYDFIDSPDQRRNALLQVFKNAFLDEAGRLKTGELRPTPEEIIEELRVHGFVQKKPQEPTKPRPYSVPYIPRVIGF